MGSMLWSQSHLVFLAILAIFSPQIMRYALEKQLQRRELDKLDREVEFISNDTRPAASLKAINSGEWHDSRGFGHFGLNDFGDFSAPIPESIPVSGVYDFAADFANEHMALREMVSGFSLFESSIESFSENIANQHRLSEMDSISSQISEAENDLRQSVIDEVYGLGSPLDFLDSDSEDYAQVLDALVATRYRLLPDIHSIDPELVEMSSGLNPYETEEEAAYYDEYRAADELIEMSSGSNPHETEEEATYYDEYRATSADDELTEMSSGLNPHETEEEAAYYDEYRAKSSAAEGSSSGRSGSGSYSRHNPDSWSL